MATKKRGLGKGLDALLSGSHSLENETSVTSDKLMALPIDLVQRGQYQPRSEFNQEALNELAESIKTQGVVQPVVVRYMASVGRYELIAGERRWRAAQLAGLHNIPAVVRQITDQEAMCISLIENIQREDLNPLEEARALNKLLSEFNLTHEAVAEAVGRSRSSVSNILRLLELEDSVKDLLDQGTLEMGHARAILTLPVLKQIEVANIIVKRGLSVRATESLVKSFQTGKVKNQSDRKIDPNIRQLQDNLSEKLGAKVSINHGAKGKGTLKIQYNSLGELDGILEKIR